MAPWAPRVCRLLASRCVERLVGLRRRRSPPRNGAAVPRRRVFPNGNEKKYMSATLHIGVDGSPTGRAGIALAIALAARMRGSPGSRPRWRDIAGGVRDRLRAAPGCPAPAQSRARRRQNQRRADQHLRPVGRSPPDTLPKEQPARPARRRLHSRGPPACSWATTPAGSAHPRTVRSRNPPHRCIGGRSSFADGRRRKPRARAEWRWPWRASSPAGTARNRTPDVGYAPRAPRRARPAIGQPWKTAEQDMQEKLESLKGVGATTVFGRPRR